MEELVKLVTEMGLGAALAMLVFTAFFFLLKWVLKVSSDQLIAMAEERKSWLEAQRSFNEQLHCLQEQSKMNMIASQAFYETVNEAHKFQREEHREMIQILGRINGYKDHE